VGEGTGLGLSIVHKIVQSHGGAIKVRTAAGKGTTFTVSFPIDHALLKQPG
jgi:signal transduction histidine kinase